MKKKLLVFAALLVLALAVASIASAIEVENGAVVAEGQLDSITAVGGHEQPERIRWNVAWPTCEGYGEAHFTCTVGDTTHEHWVKIAPRGHRWSSEIGENAWGRVVVEPTCTSEGYAIDVCLRAGCGAENPDSIRPIEKRDHEYDEKHYEVVKEPGCGEDGNGLGWKTCIWCGVRHPDTTGAEEGAGAHLVILDKIKHNWSDWRVDYDSDCDEHGKASRTCIRCGAVQYLDEDHPVVLDQGEEVTIEDVLPLKNEAWTVNGQELDDKRFEKISDLYNRLTELKFEYEVKRELLSRDCSYREITFTCPYCQGTSYLHDDFTVKVTEKAHDWEEERSPYVSVPAWCTTDGYDIFFCKHDDVHGHNEDPEAFKKDPADVTFADGFKKVITKAVGHDWGEWNVAEVYEKDGKKYGVYFRSCKRCFATEQKTEEVKKPGKQGLVQDEDGHWAYYVDDQISADTLLVPFQGGEFWVVNGYVAENANGLTICPDGKAYFLVAGQVARVTQWCLYDGEWFIIRNGLLDPVTGLEGYDGATFAVESGRKLHVDGLWCDPVTGTWAYCADGMVQVGFSGEVEYDGHTFTVVNGYLAD